MLNELAKQVRTYDMVNSGDRIICAVSGGADSMALLWSLYLLKDKWGITLEAAHFNHNLRGAESVRDEAFVREFCSRYEIPLTVESGIVTPGKKGLEAAARDARYAFFDSLPGKIATAHTADDNAETVLMHLVRGTGLKGLGGIVPVNGKYIRPMLGCTRQQVLALLQEYHVSYVEDSSNQTDAFLRNRLRHRVMPLLKEENPRIAQNLSQTAMDLRQDAVLLEDLAGSGALPDIKTLQQMPQALRRRRIEGFLKENGIKEPEREHILLVERLIFSANPSARAALPGGATAERVYDRLQISPRGQKRKWKLTCREADQIINTANVFTVQPVGAVRIRSREPGDSMRLPGGTKSLKKIFIDRKIPASQREQVPVVCDDGGILGVYGIGVNLNRAAQLLPAQQISVEPVDFSESCKEK